MDDLFRFVALRAPDPQLPKDAIDLTTESKFQKLLAKMRATAKSNVRFEQAQRLAEGFLEGGLDTKPLDSLIPGQEALNELYEAASTVKDSADLTAAINTIFGKPPQDIVTDPAFDQLLRHLRDSIVACFIAPHPRALPIAELVKILRVLMLITRVADGDQALDEPGAIQTALVATVLLPKNVFPLRDDLPHPVGVGDLLVVKQQLTRYEGGDIAKIENILRGEKREKTDLHAVTLDSTVVTETAKTTETTTSLDVTERFDLKTESSNVVKEDLAANAGVNVSTKYGGVEINANANIAYSLSKEQSSKAATEHAKDVTSRAASKVTELARRQETTRTIERFKDREFHSFDNTTNGDANVSGVYQWLNKVYEAQVFNYGSRLLFDFVVPEPAAFIRDALKSDQLNETIIPPEPFVLVFDNPADPREGRPISPSDLDQTGLIKQGLVTRPVTPADLAEDSDALTYFGKFVAKYGAVGMNAPPELTTTVSKALTANQDEHKHLAAADDLEIPQGYVATDIAVQGGFAIQEGDNQDGDEAMWVFVGKRRFDARGQGNLLPQAALLPAPGNGVINEQGTIPIGVESQQARDFAITVDVTCERTEAAVEQWQLDAHGTLLNAYAALLGAYRDKVEAEKVQRATEKPLGNNPGQNRIIERTELKKTCIARLAATDLYDADFDDITVNPAIPLFPRGAVPPKPNPQVIGTDQEAFVRFFEQAFEWEHIMYIFYPYYWARHETWYEEAIADNPDPLFAEFLKAGAARVVVPVRPQLEGDVRYFLMTGQLWGGGTLPEITDSDYLPITEEIKDRDNAPGDEKPQGTPWEVSLPTTLIRLRADDVLPEWKKFVLNGHDRWVPGRIANGKWEPDYGTLHADGTWTPD
jgi:hypothetical protein